MNTLIIDICPKNISPDEQAYRLSELESLVSTYGGITIVKKIQKRETPDYHTYVGSGKLEEIAHLCNELSIDLVVIGNHLKSAQMYHIEEIFQNQKLTTQIWDRMDLILKIFALHAVSPESKLQIELASIKHMGPRIFGMGMELGRQGGGSRNAKGSGETNTEIMKRHLQERTIAIKNQLSTYERTRELHRKNRSRKNLVTIGVVGYTNAGKSALTNTLTKKGVLSENKLFATLSTSVGKLWISNGENIGREFLLIDTIGFIRDLPHDLIDAFHSTLEDSLTSDLLLHVIDGSDPHIADKIEVVKTTLKHIGASQEIWMVINKIDLIDAHQKAHIQSLCQVHRTFFVSSHTKEGIETLKSELYKHFYDLHSPD